MEMITFFIVDKESKDAWKWFFRNWSAHVIKSRQDICVISDREKGILTSLHELRRFQEPRTFHRFCLRHLKSNFQSKFPNKDLNRLIWRASSARQVRKFESLMWKIKEENVEAHEYLMEIPLDKCTVSHDDGIRKGVLTTNLSESFNGVSKKARGLSVTAMVPDRMRGLARNFVREYFTIENYVATYSGSFSLVGHEAYWLSPSFRMRSNEFYCCPNRLRTTRIPLNLAHNLVVVEDVE
ncbi:hypothetical protein KY290_012902 [Solanum tuberosum]|uniref:MULE transposase domain-containing protein n=1 Tax=Solanum tuberosum TaxID=4113 RepID=A0ABQ7VK60_SOLTU|nr:hypothetical protein KY285_012657 [Solanum tuberosum]KAH0768921.1 hypothetical protein KY290_012902 [Solanum tuberosum]